MKTTKFTLTIAGGTGFLGRVLTDYFTPKTDRIYVLTRKFRPSTAHIKYILWDAKSQGDWSKILEATDILINLSGKSVDCRYNSRNKQAITNSRIEATQALGEAILNCKHPPRLWLNSSTATIYRHSLETPMDETNGELGQGFSVGVATQWERSFFDFYKKDVRQVALRTAIVFGKQGGALAPLIALSKLGLGGTQGHGRQKVSWMHELDFARSVDHIITNQELKGVINLSAPHPVSNSTLMEQIRELVKSKIGIPMPKFLLELGAIFLRTETELVLKSRFVLPKKLQESGFKFKFNRLYPALQNLIQS